MAPRHPPSNPSALEPPETTGEPDVVEQALGLLDGPRHERRIQPVSVPAQ